MPPVRMTRAEYEAQYGVKPSAAISELDNDAPIPVRMTRAEYNAIYRPELTQNQDNGFVADLRRGGEQAVEAVNRGVERQDELKQRGFLSRQLGRFTTGLEAAGGALGSIGEGVFRALPGGTTIANKLGELTESGIKTVAESEVGQSSKAAFETLPEGVQTFAQDIGRGAMGALGVGGALVAPGATSAVTRPVIRSAQETINSLGRTAFRGGNERAIERVTQEIFDIENNYAKTRNKLDRDPTASESRLRIAQSNVLNNAVDNDGLIRTKQKGGAIDQYKNTPITPDGLTLVDVEDVVKRNLETENKTINLKELRVNMLAGMMDSGLEGADLTAALKRVEREIEGLSKRADEFGNVLLSKIQDSKIATTNSIDYSKPVGVTYRKTLARIYKETIEDKSDLPVKQWNQELAKYYKDIDRLADLDGKRVKGGRLGKYTANVAGSAIGAVAGTAGGGTGALIGGIVGGEVASAIRGRAMAGTFNRGVNGEMPQSRILSQANARAGIKDLSKPDLQVGAPKTLLSDPDLPPAVRKEITKIESQIKLNVKQQKAAIAAGDFTLVETLKGVYQVLVDRLKEVIADYRKNGPSLGLSIRKSVTPESVARAADPEDIRLLARVIDDPSLAKIDPDIRRVLYDMGLGRATEDELVRFAKDVIDTRDGVANRQILQRDLNENQNQATAAPTIAQNISDTVPPTTKSATTKTTDTPTNLLEEAKKYKSAGQITKQTTDYARIEGAELDPSTIKLSGDVTEKTAKQRAANMSDPENNSPVTLKVNKDGTLQVVDGNARVTAFGNQGKTIKTYIIDLKKSDKDALNKLFR